SITGEGGLRPGHRSSQGRSPTLQGVGGGKRGSQPMYRLDSGSWDTEGMAAAAGLSSEAGKNHLVVLVHGLGGKAQDMGLMRGFLQTLMPAAEVMVATSLESSTSTQRKENLGIEELGKRLAEEIQTHILRFCPSLSAHTTGSTVRHGAPNPPLSPMTPLSGKVGHFL
ncbi:unnamed protein product, partial [Discosporangium mesarthrocarpum]